MSSLLRVLVCTLHSAMKFCLLCVQNVLLLCRCSAGRREAQERWTASCACEAHSTSATDYQTSNRSAWRWSGGAASDLSSPFADATCMSDRVSGTNPLWFAAHIYNICLQARTWGLETLIQAMVKDQRLNQMLLPASKLRKLVEGYAAYGEKGRCRFRVPFKHLWLILLIVGGANRDAYIGGYIGGDVCILLVTQMLSMRSLNMAVWNNWLTLIRESALKSAICITIHSDFGMLHIEISWTANFYLFLGVHRPLHVPLKPTVCQDFLDVRLLAFSAMKFILFLRTM